MKPQTAQFIKDNINTLVVFNKPDIDPLTALKLAIYDSWWAPSHTQKAWIVKPAVKLPA
jgi:hypothetical protein